MDRFDSIVVGGGFFGTNLALTLKRQGRSVTLVEREKELLTRSSYRNQARVHGGYHYPRSLLTGLRSRANYARFISEFKSCIDTSFSKYYAIARHFSNVNANQFQLFCKRIDAPLQKASKEIKRLFHSDYIEEVFEVEECAFDASKLREQLLDRIQGSAIPTLMETSAILIKREGDLLSLDTINSGGEKRSLKAKEIFLCLYSGVNQVLFRSSLPGIPLRHELTEICLVEPPEEIADLGITVMCGPFFSAMPFPARKLHSLSHVRYTPHFSWNETRDPLTSTTLDLPLSPPESHFLHMKKDASRYLPILSECRQIDSLWEIKTVLPRNEQDDARPILFLRDHGLKGLSCIIGAKIDNIFDTEDTAAAA